QNGPAQLPAHILIEVSPRVASRRCLATRDGRVGYWSISIIERTCSSLRFRSWLARAWSWTVLISSCSSPLRSSTPQLQRTTLTTWPDCELMGGLPAVGVDMVTGAAIE